MNLLLIEPHRDSRNALAALLGMEGHTVTAAASATMGIKEARRCDHDAIITELRMPESLSAGWLIKCLREADPYTEIIVTSSIVGCEAILDYLRQENPLSAARSAGADCFIAKPVDFGSLLQLLASSRSNRLRVIERWSKQLASVECAQVVV